MRTFTENYIHGLVCLLYAIVQSSPSAIVGLTITTRNPSLALFVDPDPSNYSDAVHATELLPPGCIAFRLLMSRIVLSLYCRRSVAFGTGFRSVRLPRRGGGDSFQFSLSLALSCFCVSTGSHVRPRGGSTFNGISQVARRVRSVFPPVAGGGPEGRSEARTGPRVLQDYYKCVILVLQSIYDTIRTHAMSVSWCSEGCCGL